MTYKAVVKDYRDDENCFSAGGFKTPEDAFIWAKKMAIGTGFSGVYYWVEDEDISPRVEGFSGCTGVK